MNDTNTFRFLILFFMSSLLSYVSRLNETSADDENITAPILKYTLKKIFLFVSYFFMYYGDNYHENNIILMNENI